MAKTGKKKTGRPIKKPEVFNWTTQRRKAALLLSEGLYNNKEVASMVKVTPQTISVWRQSPEFLKEIDRLTFENELATRAGLLRLAFQGVGTNRVDLKEDKNTTLDWAKFIIDLIPQDTKDDDDKLRALTDAIMASAGK